MKMWEEAIVCLELMMSIWILPIYGSKFKSLDFDDENPLGPVKDYAYYDDPNLELHMSNLLPKPSDMNNLPDCQKQCTQKFTEAMAIIMQKGSHYDKFHKVCSHRELFDVATSGLHYMCVEQREAFEASIECIDAQASKITKECDNECHVEEKFSSWAMNSGIMEAFREGKMPTINVDFLQRFITDGCEIAKCYLACVKTKFDQRCNGTAGALLSEFFVRPLAESHSLVAFSSMAGIMRMFVPKECSFILSSQGLEPYRIDPTLNKELKKMYKNRPKTTLAPEPTTMDILPPENNPESIVPLEIDPTLAFSPFSTTPTYFSSKTTFSNEEEMPTDMQLKPVPNHDKNTPPPEVTNPSETHVFDVKIPSPDSNPPNHLPPHPMTNQNPLPPPKPQNMIPINEPSIQNRANFGPPDQIETYPNQPYVQGGMRANYQIYPLPNKGVNTPFGELRPPPPKSTRVLDKEGEFYHKKLYANKTVLVEIMVYPEFEGQLSCEIRKR